MSAHRRCRPTDARLAATIIAAVLALSSAAAHAGGPTVVELFTSQSCYSCPPAEAFLGELTEHENVVALEFHVDYWNDLVYGSAGRWEDLFSDATFTERQRRYAARIPGSQVYTPQIVLDGVVQTVGSRRGRVLHLIERSRAAPKPVRVSVERTSTEGLSVTVEPAAEGRVRAEAEILLVRYDLRHVTAVEAGENKGKTLANHHVVRELRLVGEWRGERVELPVARLRLGPNQGCAVLVQSADQGAILGAATCPS